MNQYFKIDYNMKKFFKRMFCKHKYLVTYTGTKFEQCPFHRPGIGYMFDVTIMKCSKCGKDREDKIWIG